MSTSHRPWSALHHSMADELRPALVAVAEAALQEIGEQLPALGIDLAGEFGGGLRRGIDLALNRLLDLFGTDDAALDPSLATVYEVFGERESQHGRSLEALLAAYRIGARVSWARLSAAALASGVDVGQLVVLAESIFEYIDELSAASATGHARHHAAHSAYRDAQRSRLAEALVEGQAATMPARVNQLAADLGWSIPARMAVAVLPLQATPRTAASSSSTAVTSSVAAPVLPVAPPDVLRLDLDGEVLAVLPDPSGPGRRTRLTALVGPTTAVYVGTVRPPEEAPISLAHARAVQRLVADGVVPPDRVVAAADHLPALVLHADPRLLADLTARTLAPLDAVAARRREVLVRTLRTWLRHQGDRAVVAARLRIHPQTVSYRMAQLGALFGPALDDPAGRLALTLALEAGG